MRLDRTGKEDFEALSSRELLKYFDLYCFQYGIFPNKKKHIKNLQNANLELTNIQLNEDWQLNPDLKYEIIIKPDKTKNKEQK